jgi:sulfotransferase 6B1
MSQNPLLVKIKKLSKKVYGMCRSGIGSGAPCFVNSFPKSGTHMLSQVFDRSKVVVDYGRFVTMASTVRFKKATSDQVTGELLSIKRGELVKGHIFHQADFVDALSGSNVPTFFIYRDLRSCVVSEMHYLSGINRFHRLSRYFSNKLSQDERLALAINGLPGGGPTGLYENIGERFKPFLGWVDDPNVLAIKFEDFKADPERQIGLIWSHFRNVVDYDFDISELVAGSLNSIAPQRSHTFRSGSVDGWKREFDTKNLGRFEEICGDINRQLGY